MPFGEAGLSRASLLVQRPPLQGVIEKGVNGSYTDLSLTLWKARSNEVADHYHHGSCHLWRNSLL